MSLRPATLVDAEAIGRLSRLTTRISLPFLPELHSAEEDTAFVRDRLMAKNTVWAWEERGAIVGYVAFDEDWIDHLFVHPDHHGRGIGSALLARAMEDGRPRRLWTFQKNAPARAFYESKGWTAIRFTDGAENIEREPDVLYASDGRIDASERALPT